MTEVSIKTGDILKIKNPVDINLTSCEVFRHYKIDGVERVVIVTENRSPWSGNIKYNGPSYDLSIEELKNLIIKDI